MVVIHDSPSRFATTNEAARLLRLSPSTVRRLVRNHELPGTKIGGSYRVDLDALDQHVWSPRDGADD